MKCIHPQCDQIETNYHTVCCTNCGMELESKLDSSVMGQFSDWRLVPLLQQYTRTKRFMTMLDSVILGVETRNDFKVLALLHNLKIPFQDIDEIIFHLKQSKIPDKRYISLHLFSKVFLSDHTPISVTQINRFYDNKFRMKTLFECIETRFVHMYGKHQKPFINYRFMVEVFLLNFGFMEMKKHVKTIKCPKRYQRNVDTLTAMEIKLGGRDLLIPGSSGEN